MASGTIGIKFLEFIFNPLKKVVDNWIFICYNAFKSSENDFMNSTKTKEDGNGAVI
jgi:hypothetical protein